MKSVKLNLVLEVKYDGQIENDKPNGIGNIFSTDGTNYEGEWRDGLKNYQGRLIYLDEGK